MANRRKDRLKIEEFKADTSSTQCDLCGMSLGDRSMRYGGLCMSCHLDCQEYDILLGVFGYGKEVLA